MNIVLTGYMGTGKTSVARELQKILGWEFIDTDELIVQEEKRSINDIFAKDGEKYFRDKEAEIIKGVSKLDKKIISTGGGAVLRKENIENFKKNGIVVCLTATPEKIFERIKRDQSRPLLKVEDPLSKIKEMLEIRKQFYENCNYFIDTTDFSVKEIAEKIKDLIPYIIHVNLEKNSYNIYIGDISNLKNFLKKDNTKGLIISDQKVFNLYPRNTKDTNNIYTFLGSFFPDNKKENEYIHSVNIDTKNDKTRSEQYKGFDEIRAIYLVCTTIKLDRKSVIIAFGGGVVGDMAGFVASTYLRGIDFIQIPTTLLAQVDASIGGKTGFDLEFGKNLVGTFYQPKLVWIDPNFLKTLDDREYKNGLAEVIKYGFIYKNCYMEENFWNFLDVNIDKILGRNDDDILKKMLFLSAQAKANVVSADEKEGSLRKILNFGHTLGHAIETYQNYTKLKHGEAVALGMAFATYLSLEMGFCDKSVETALLKLLNKTDFEIEKWKKEIFCNDFVFDKIIGIMSHDKKMSSGKVDFILPFKTLGEVKIESLDLNFIKNMLIKWSKGE